MHGTLTVLFLALPSCEPGGASARPCASWHSGLHGQSACCILFCMAGTVIKLACLACRSLYPPGSIVPGQAYEPAASQQEPLADDVPPVRFQLMVALNKVSSPLGCAAQRHCASAARAARGGCRLTCCPSRPQPGGSPSGSAHACSRRVGAGGWGWRQQHMP
jgi:hypothetical protein